MRTNSSNDSCRIMNFSLQGPSFIRNAATGFVLFLLPLVAAAQSSFVWTTNFYSVTGGSFREIRQSINQSRPWKDPFDGITQWTVEWKFNFAPARNGCACSGPSTSTRIITTMPRWTPPTGVPTEVIEQWTRFFVRLARHEAGHARIGAAAAAAVRKAIEETGPQPDCDALKKLVTENAERAITEYRRRDSNYDRITEHGAKPDGTR